MFALVLALALGGHMIPGKPPEGAVCNPAEVAAAMKQLAQHPDDLTVRRRLLTYYLHRHQDPALRKARIDQIAWMVEHHPEVKLFDQRAWIVDARDREGFARVRELWLRQVRRFRGRAAGAGERGAGVEPIGPRGRGGVAEEGARIRRGNSGCCTPTPSSA